MEDNKKSLNKKYIVTYIVEFFVLLSGLLCFRFASFVFGDSGFAEYSLLRRSISFILPLMVVGMNIGTTRLIALKSSTEKKEIITGIFASTLIILLSFFSLFAGIILIFKQYFSWLFFSNNKYEYLILPMLIFLLGSVLQTATYSYYRGLMKMHMANLIQFLNLGIGNVAGFLFFDDIVSVISFAGCFWITTNSLFLLLIFIKNKGCLLSFSSNFKSLMSYGIQRVPGDFTLAGLFALPSYMAAHYFSLQAGGYVAFGLSLLTMGSAVFSPISLILLPQATTLIAKNQIKKLKIVWIKIMLSASIISISATFLYLFLAQEILEIYLGEATQLIVNITQLIILAAPAYMLYVAIRTINDAAYHLAVNTISLIISFAVFASVSMLFTSNINAFLYTFAVAMYVLTLITLYWNIKIFKKNNCKFGKF